MTIAAIKGTHVLYERTFRVKWAFPDGPPVADRHAEWKPAAAQESHVGRAPEYARYMVDEPRYCYRHPDRETGLSCSECGRPICYECMTPAPVGLRCPEHSGKPQGMRRATAAAERAVTGSSARSTAIVTKVLIAINVGVYLAELALGGTIDGLNNKIYYKGVLFAHGTFDGSPGVADGGWWRLFTSSFLHYGPIHLGLNMLALYWFGPLLEGMLGSLRFGLLYIASGLAGSAGALLLSPNDITVGASGAIFGILGALLVLEQRRMIHSGGQILALIILNLLLGFTLSGISIGGHIGGLIAGAVTMLLYLQFRRSTAICAACAFGVMIVSVIVAYAVV
jgi:membrane associated rhomboid family serine protease